MRANDNDYIGVRANGDEYIGVRVTGNDYDYIGVRANGNIELRANVNDYIGVRANKWPSIFVVVVDFFFTPLVHRSSLSLSFSLSGCCQKRRTQSSPGGE